MKGREPQQRGDGSAESRRAKSRQRLGGNGGGLSLMSFANAKSKQSGYNPALIKKQREFYKNAKLYKKYKKMVKNRRKPEGTNLLDEIGQDIEKISNYESSASTSQQKKKPKKDTRLASLREELEQKQKEKEREREERERTILAKKAEREKAEAARKARKQKMSRRTTSGQPIMRYRIENIVDSLKYENT